MKKQKRKRKIDKAISKYADKNATLANRLRVLITGAQAIGQMAVETLKKAKTSKKKITWDTKVVDKTNFNEAFVAGMLKCQWLKEEDYDCLEFPADKSLQFKPVESMADAVLTMRRLLVIATDQQ